MTEFYHIYDKQYTVKLNIENKAVLLFKGLNSLTFTPKKYDENTKNPRVHPPHPSGEISCSLARIESCHLQMKNVLSKIQYNFNISMHFEQLLRWIMQESSVLNVKTFANAAK